MADESTTAPFRKGSDIEPTPQGLAERWETELEAADKRVEDWHKKGKKIEERYLDEREDAKGARSRLNLFHGDVETRKALLFDNTPRVRAKRRYADANDDLARVSAEMWDRLLNSDIERESDGFTDALELCRDDRLLPGLGVMRFRYVVEWGDPIPEQPAQMGACPKCAGSGRAGMMSAMDDGPGHEAAEMPGNMGDADCDGCQGSGQAELAPAVAEQKQKESEDVETDYVPWDDFRWGPARTWRDVPWVAFKADLTLDEAQERFPDIDVEKLPVDNRRDEASDENKDTWARIAVWEVWDRTTKTVYWHVRGHAEILDSKPDPLELPGFFPCQRPILASVTTRKLIPQPDFAIAQDLYDEIDDLTDRIRNLVAYARVVGAYDKSNEGLQRLLDSTYEGKLVPVESFAQLMQNGGLAGAISWLPLEPIVAAVVQLVQKRQESIQQLYQVTGMSDIMRGQATGSATATEQRIKARFGSSRTRSEQKKFARFAQGGQRIRAAIIAKHFDAKTIIERSNVLATPDAPLAQQAAELMKQDVAQYRIEIAEDSLAMTDYDAVKQERTEVIAAIGGYMQSMMPLAQDSTTRPFVLKGLQWMIAGLRGASQFETVIDEAIKASEQAAQQAAQMPKPPDPHLQAVQVKAQAEIGKAQAGIQQTQIDAQAHQQGTQLDMAAKRQEFGMRMAELRAKEQSEQDTGLPVPPGTPV